MKFETEPQRQAQAQALCTDLMPEKHARLGETSADQLSARVAAALGDDEDERARFLRTMEAGFVPGAPIIRAAGAGTAATMGNCFLQPVGDTLDGRDESGTIGLTDAIAQAAETMRLGGAVGYDFSRIRPMGSLVRGTPSRASGPVCYMRMFDRLCETVEQAGGRRCSQMGVLRVDHPDIERFIDAKKMPDFAAMGLDANEKATLMRMMREKPGFGSVARQAFATLGNFNLSVALTDEFMRAVIDDGAFDLVHKARPREGFVPVKKCVDGEERHVYRTVRARDIWDRIMRNTYEGAELGVIFIDRVNRDNNLWYAERIDGGNRCAEQFLPASGCCDLGGIMVPRFVRDPFSPSATFDRAGFAAAVSGAVELLDKVLDKTEWPLPQQHVEAMNKRRIALGYLALVDAMAMLGIRPGSPAAATFTVEVGTLLRDEAYAASVRLAIKHGPFPLFNADKYLRDGSFASRLPQHIKDDIREFGIRNSHLLSMAPSGTISMAFGDNGSSGIEPGFSRRQDRLTISPEGTSGEFALENVGHRYTNRMLDGALESNEFVTALPLSVEEHLAILEAATPLIDGASSMTGTVSTDFPFEGFADLYVGAWMRGIKGITMCRPHGNRPPMQLDAIAGASTDSDQVDDLGRDIGPKGDDGVACAAPSELIGAVRA